MTYVRVVPAGSGALEGAFSFVGTSKAARFVMVSISSETTANRRIELLAHELQHAVDAAGIPWVTNNIQFQMYMDLSGWRDANTAIGFETASACRTERQVRKELHGISEPQELSSAWTSRLPPWRRARFARPPASSESQPRRFATRPGSGRHARSAPRGAAPVATQPHHRLAQQEGA